MLHHLKAIWTFRYFWASLVRADLRMRYRRSVLGIGWSVLNPIAMSAVFCIVFSQIMPVSGNKFGAFGYTAEWQGYGAYMLAGLATWDVIRNSLSGGCHALIHNEAYIRQCPLPYGIYPLRTVLGTFIHFLISMVVVLTLVSVLRGSVAPFTMLPVLLPAFVMLFLFCWSVATITAFATPYFHDTAHLVDVGAQLMFFLTPLLYFREMMDERGFGFLADLNPVVTFLEMIRSPIVFGIVPEPVVYVQGATLTVAALGLAAGTIGWLQKKVIFQL